MGHQWDGSSYEGQWQNDKPHGQGVAQYSDGSCYQGQWQDGEKQGVGTLYEENGKLKQGIWENDKLVKKQELAASDSEDVNAC